MTREINVMKKDGNANKCSDKDNVFKISLGGGGTFFKCTNI